ncbi:hypothetical protein PGT21_011353 [Puccinia graminis f. sp. tritici]|nr:hypothetical protein PGT21_011353 [Puccinia graminis f. sp. tritici]
MDPSHSAYNRIRQFLANLNLVLGPVSHATTCGPLPNFYPIRFPRNLDLRNPHQQFLSKRPTACSQSWRKTHSRICAQNFPNEHWLPQLKSANKHYEIEKRPRDKMNQLMRQQPVNNTDMPYMNYQPLSVPKRSRQTQPNVRYQTPPHSFEADHPSSEAVEHNKPYLQGPEDGQDVHEESGFRNDKCPSNCNHLDNECPNDLDEHVDDLSEQEQASETVSDNCDPEVLPEVVPQSNNPWVPEPAFSMDNYSARDVDCWARTLSADQFEQL